MESRRPSGTCKDGGRPTAVGFHVLRLFRLSMCYFQFCDGSYLKPISFYEPMSPPVHLIKIKKRLGKMSEGRENEAPCTPSCSAHPSTHQEKQASLPRCHEAFVTTAFLVMSPAPAKKRRKVTSIEKEQVVKNLGELLSF